MRIIYVTKVTSNIRAGTARLVCIPVHLLRCLQSVLIGQVCHWSVTLGVHQRVARQLVYTDLGGWANTVQTDDLEAPRCKYWHSSSFYCQLRFIVSLTFLPVDAYVLLPPTLWLFVRQWIVTVGDLAFPASAAKVLNKLPDDVCWTLVYLDILLNDLQCKHKKLTAVFLFCGHTRLHRRITKSTKT